MKKKLLLLHLLSAALFADAQNVGIGTATPLQKLHVEGIAYINGNVGIGSGNPPFALSFGPVLGDKISLWSNSTNSYGFGIQGSLLQIHTDISAADIAFGYGSSAVFTERMRIKGNGNVGIGTTNPNAPLGFPPVLGKKITLYPGGTGDVGLAVQGNLLQIYADHPNADIAFGYDQGGVFTERMRIRGNGNIGIGTAIPAASAQLDVSSTTKGFLPPRMTSSQRDAITTPEEGLMIYNSTTKTPNFYTGTEWRDIFVYAIGDNYQGGKIAYILQPGDPGYIAGQTHGLIAAAIDQDPGGGAEWGCDGTAIPGADGTALGTGNQNTIDIMAGCATGDIAARICGNLVLNGYSDWYLPSKDELNKLYINKVAVGGFTSLRYWSSSEDSGAWVWSQHFADGSQNLSGKINSFRVRAIRSF